MKKQVLLSLMMFSIILVYSTSITFSFDNIQLTGTTIRSLEFDVMAKAGETGTILGETQVYIQYNSFAFGDSVVIRSNLVVTKGSLLLGEIVPGVGLYSEPIVADNEGNILTIQSSNLIIGYGNPFPVEFTDILHVKMTIQDSTIMSGISMVEDLMLGQQYEADRETLYIPINIENNLNVYLRFPEQPEITSIVRNENSISITWNSTGATTYYEVLSSEFPGGPFLLDTSGEFNNTTWSTSVNSAEKKKFYRIIAHN